MAKRDPFKAITKPPVYPRTTPRRGRVGPGTVADLSEQPPAMGAAIADLERALEGRPAASAPQTQRPGPARGQVIDPTPGNGLART